MLYDFDDKLKNQFAMGTGQCSLAEVKLRQATHAEALQRDLFKFGPKDYLSVSVPSEMSHPEGDRTIHSITHHPLTDQSRPAPPPAALLKAAEKYCSRRSWR
ncbi:MAG: hypothetical protein WCK77_07100 [Verrucomicrobiota bacterium]